MKAEAGRPGYKTMRLLIFIKDMNITNLGVQGACLVGKMALAAQCPMCPAGHWFGRMSLGSMAVPSPKVRVCGWRLPHSGTGLALLGSWDPLRCLEVNRG